MADNNKSISMAPGSSSFMLTLQDYLTSHIGSIVNETIPFFVELVSVKPDMTTELVPLRDGDVEVFAIRLDINPATISMNMSRIFNRTQTMTGWVEEHWGEEIDTVTFQGSTAAFVVGGRSLWGVRKGGAITQQTARDANLRRPFNQAFGIIDTTPVAPDNQIGLTTTYRRNSISYMKMKKLLQLMHTNGCRFGNTVDNGTTGSIYQIETDSLGLVSDRNYIRISSDYAMWLGYIESFDLTEAAEIPFRFQYTITFKSEVTQLTYLK